MSDSDSEAFTIEDDKALHPYYKIETMLGEGNFGMVKKAIHLLTNEYVAIKIIEKENIVEQKDIDRIAREIMILKKLRHRNIIQLYEIIETNEKLYLILEYAEGGELYDYIIEKERLSESEAMLLYTQLLTAIEYIHSQSIAHRDLKPENILLDSSLTLKLIDFGLGNLYSPSKSLLTPCGSPCYASPEMIKCIPYSPIKSDIYSSGIVLFAMLTGYLPYEDSNILKCSEKILEGKLIIPDYLSKECGDFLAGLLKVEEEQRFDLTRIKKNLFFRQTAGVEGGAYDGVEEGILIELEKLGLKKEEVERDVREGRRNHLTTCYFLQMNKRRRGVRRGKSKTFLEGGRGKGEKKERKMTVPVQKMNEQNNGKSPPDEEYREFQRNEMDRGKDEINSVKAKSKSKSVFESGGERTKGKEEGKTKRKTTYNNTSYRQDDFESPIRLDKEEPEQKQSNLLNEKKNTIYSSKEEEKLDNSIYHEGEIEAKKASPNREKSKSISSSKQFNEEQSLKKKRYTTYEKNTDDGKKFLTEIKNQKSFLKQENHIPNSYSIKHESNRDSMEIEKNEAAEEYRHPPDPVIKSQIGTQSMTRKINKSSSISLANEEKNSFSHLKRKTETSANYIKQIEIKQPLQEQPTEEKDNFSIDDNDLNSSQNSERGGKSNKKQSKPKSIFQNASNNPSNSNRYSIENTELTSSYKDKPNQEEELIYTQNNTINEPKKKTKSNSVLILAEDRRKEEIEQRRKTTYNPSSFKQTSEHQPQLEKEEKRKNTFCKSNEDEQLDASIDQEEEIEIKRINSPIREKSKSISSSRKVNEEQSIKKKRYTTTTAYDRNATDDNKFLVEKKNKLNLLKQENNNKKQSDSSVLYENCDERDDEEDAGQPNMEKTGRVNIQNVEYEGYESQMQQKKNPTFHDDKKRIIESEEELNERNEDQVEKSKKIQKTRGKSNSISFSALKEKEAFDKRRLTTIQKEEKDWESQKFEKNSQKANSIEHDEDDGDKNEEKSVDLDQHIISSEEEIENHGVDIRKEVKTKREQSKSIAYNCYSNDNKLMDSVHKRYSMLEKNVVVDDSSFKSLGKDDLVRTSKENNSSSKASNQRSISISASPDSNFSENKSNKKRYTTIENNQKGVINWESDKKNTNENAIMTSEVRNQSVLEKKTNEENLELEAKSDKKKENRQKSKSIILNEKLENQKSNKKRYTTIEKTILNEFERNSVITRKEENQKKEHIRNNLEISINKNDEKDQESDVEESEIISKKMINKTKSKSIAFSSIDAKIEELKKQKKRLTTYEKAKFEINSNEVRNDSEERNKILAKDVIKSRAKSNSTIAKPQQNFENEEITVLKESKIDEKEVKAKKIREKSKSIINNTSNFLDRNELKPRKSMQNELEYKNKGRLNKEIEKNDEYEGDHDRFDDTSNDKKVNFMENCQEYIRKDKKRVTKAAFNRPVELDENYEEEENDNIKNEDENKNEENEPKRKVNFESSASGIRKNKKKKTEANFSRPAELDQEEEDEDEEIDKSNQRKVNFNSNAREGEPKPKKRVTMANFKKFEDSEEEEQINNQPEQYYQEEEEPNQRKVNFDSEVKGEPKQKKRVTMANLTKYEDSDEEKADSLLLGPREQSQKEKDDGIEEIQQKSKASALRRKDKGENKKKAVLFSNNVPETKTKPKQRLTMGNFKRPSELDEEDNEEIDRLIRKEQELSESQEYDDTEMEGTTILNDESTVGRQREEESMKNIDFYDKNPDHDKVKVRSQSVRLESNKNLDKNQKDQAIQKRKTFTINDNKDIINDKIPFAFMQGPPLKQPEETKMNDRNIESCSDVEESNRKQQKQSKIVNRTKSNSVRMEKPDHLLKEKRKTFDVNSGQVEIFKRDSKLEELEDKNLSDGGDSDLENEVNSSSNINDESFGRGEEEEKEIKEKNIIKQRGKYHSLIQPKDEENFVDERKRKTLANTNSILKKESESDNKAESSLENESSVEKEEEDFEFDYSNEKQKPKFKSLFLNQHDSIEIAKKRQSLNEQVIAKSSKFKKESRPNEEDFEFDYSNEKQKPKFKSLFINQHDSIEIAKKRQSLNEKAITKSSKFKKESKPIEQSSEEKEQPRSEEKIEKKHIKSRNKSNSVFLTKNEENNQEPNKNSRKTCILNTDSISDKRVAFDLKEFKDQTIEKQITQPLEKQENQQKEKDDSQKKSRNKSSSVIITSVNLQNLKPSSTSRKTVAIFANPDPDNDKFNEYLNNINEKSLDFEEIKKNAERKAKEEEPDVREKNIENIESKRKIEHKSHSVLISEKEQKNIHQNFNGRKTIATSYASSNKFQENNLQNNINHKNEENCPSDEGEAIENSKNSPFLDEKALNPASEKQYDSSSQKKNCRRKPKHLEKVYNILKKNRMSYETLKKTVENPLYNEKEISELSKSIISNNRSNINSSHKSNISSKLIQSEKVEKNELYQFFVNKNVNDSFSTLLQILDKLELDYEKINEHKINVLFDSEFEIEVEIKKNEQNVICSLVKLMGDDDRYHKFYEDLKFLIN